MPPTDESETFSQWRIWIIKTLDKLSTDVEMLKSLTGDKHEYLRKFEVVEHELREVKDKIGMLDISAAVSKRTLVIYSSIAAFIGSAATALMLRYL
jgi:hypothetical protein